MTLIWREMKRSGEPTGSHSASDPGSLHFMCYFRYDQFRTGELSILARYTVDGDTIDEHLFDTPQEALAWIQKELEEAIKVNMKVEGQP